MVWTRWLDAFREPALLQGKPRGTGQHSCRWQRSLACPQSGTAVSSLLCDLGSKEWPGGDTGCWNTVGHFSTPKMHRAPEHEAPHSEEAPSRLLDSGSVTTLASLHSSALLTYSSCRHRWVPAGGAQLRPECQLHQHRGRLQLHLRGPPICTWTALPW